MALGENIKRERMIPVRNRIVYNRLQQELEELKDQNLTLSEPNYDISAALENLSKFEEENEIAQTHSKSKVEFFSHINDILEHCFMVAELDSSNLQILKANEIFCQALQITPTELHVRSLREFFVKEKTTEWDTFCEKLNKGERVQTMLEFLPKNATEQEKLICSATLVSKPAQQSTIYILIAQNITAAISAYRSNTTIEIDIDKKLKSAKIIVKI